MLGQREKTWMLLFVLVPLPIVGLLSTIEKSVFYHNKTPSISPFRFRFQGKNRVSESSQSDFDQDDSSPKELYRRRGIAVALFSTYFTVMGAKCALPSVLPQLTSSRVGLSYIGWGVKPQILMAQLLTLSTFAVALGKLLLGPLIDTFGGVIALQACLSILAIMLSIIALADRFTTFAVAWLVVDFVFSSCWASCVNAVQYSFPDKEWAKQIGMIAAAARTGNATAFFIFAAVLQWANRHLSPDFQSWRLVFGAASILQVVPLLLLSYFSRLPLKVATNETENESPLTDSVGTIRNSLQTLKKQASTLEFWFHLISRSALMLFGSFLLFVPTLMSEIYGLSSSQAAKVGSIFAIGCLTSVTTCSHLYSVLSKRKKILLSIFFLGSATVCSLAQLCHMSGVVSLSPEIGIATMFFWGFSFATPFYVPPSLFAIVRGGKESSATISDVFDIFGFGLLAFFNGYVASIQHSAVAAWILTFRILTGCAMLSMITLSLAITLE
jgi:MFS family permease